jgi:hypothetical protein
MTELSETFWILLTTSGFAFLGLVIRYALRSKCDRVECLCFKIHRNTDQEHDVEMPEPAQPQPSPTSRQMSNLQITL